MPDPTTPDELLRAALVRDAARPLVTYYDDATGERVELSVATFANWVAKTAGLLQDGLSVAPGERVDLLLPAHWQSLVWASACWAVGAVVGDGSAPNETPTVAVVGPDTLDADTGAGEVVSLSLRPLGGRFTTPLPAGMLDYALEVPSYPDRFVALAEPGPDDAGLGGESLGAIVEAARRRAELLGLGESARVLVPTDKLHDAILDALLVPLRLGGSAVLVRHEDVSRRAARIEAERVTAVVAE